MFGAILLAVVACFCTFMTLTGRASISRSVRRSRQYEQLSRPDRLERLRSLERQAVPTFLLFMIVGGYLIATGSTVVGVMGLVLFAVCLVWTLVWTRRERRRLRPGDAA